MPRMTSLLTFSATWRHTGSVCGGTGGIMEIVRESIASSGRASKDKSDGQLYFCEAWQRARDNGLAEGCGRSAKKALENGSNV